MDIENKKLDVLLQWVKDKENEAGEKADKASDLNKEIVYMRYNHIWSTYGQVRKYVEELLKS